jgi:hypothetical protein
VTNTLAYFYTAVKRVTVQTLGLNNFKNSRMLKRWSLIENVLYISIEQCVLDTHAMQENNNSLKLPQMSN